MATETKPFSPFLTQQWRGMELSEVLDRNLLAIKAALDVANATIIKQQLTIDQIINGDTIINITGAAGRQGIAGLDADDSDSGSLMAPIPGPPGVRGRDGLQGVTGADGDDGLDGMPGLTGQRGSDGVRGVAGLDGADGDDGGGFLPTQEISGMPLGFLPSDYTATGDVTTILNGDSRISGGGGFTPYCRVVVGPYGINSPAVLSIEDGAALAVI